MEEKRLKKNKTREVILIGLLFLIILTVCVSITYAFFAIDVESTPENIGLKAGTLQMTFRDNDDGINAQLNFGESVTKKFVIENTGTLPVVAKINWKDLVNTYLFKSLSYTLSYGETYSETDDGYKVVKTSYDNVPPSEEASIRELADGLVIPAGTTYYYTLTVRLEDLEDVDQTADLKAIFTTKFDIEEGTAGLLTDKMTLAAKSWNPDLSKIAPYPISYKDGVGDATSGIVTLVGRTDNVDRSEYYYTYAESYTFDSETGTYSLVDPQVVKYKDGLETLKGKYIVDSNGSSQNKLANYSDLGYIYLVLDTSDLTIMYFLAITKTPLSYDYSNDGVYTAEDDYGTSYYYRGAITNNYVKFGVNASRQDMYWRIIRLNGDGSLRIIYDGTQTWTNGVNNTNRRAFVSVFNNNMDDNKYVGYMFGGAQGVASTTLTGAGGAQTNETSSTVKTKLDEWYEQVFKGTAYEEYIADAIFCNDRSFAASNTGTGIGLSITTYGANDRITGTNPTLKCPEQNDAFTVNDTTKGNGALTYPIGLITADEMILAGGRLDNTDGMSINNGFYLYKGFGFWTMTSGFFRYMTTSYQWYVAKNSSLNAWTITNTSQSVVPVINIKAEYLDQLSGNGTQSNPYYFEI